MIKIALKHWIFEKCIDVIFRGITTNFSLINEKDLQVGNKYWLIEAYAFNGVTNFYECEIIGRYGMIIEIRANKHATWTDSTWGCAEVIEKTINKYIHINRITKIS